MANRFKAEDLSMGLSGGNPSEAVWPQDAY